MVSELGDGEAEWCELEWLLGEEDVMRRRVGGWEWKPMMRSGVSDWEGEAMMRMFNDWRSGVNEACI